MFSNKIIMDIGITIINYFGSTGNISVLIFLIFF